jgi:hypothetical protein
MIFISVLTGILYYSLLGMVTLNLFLSESHTYVKIGFGITELKKSVSGKSSSYANL